MTILIVTMCLIADQNACRDLVQPISENLTPYQCTMRAQEVMPEMMAHYPKWRVARYKCVTESKGIEI